MAIPPESSNWLDVVWTALLAVLAFLIGLLRHNALRIEEKADAALTRQEFKEQIARRDMEYNRLRADIKELFERDEKLKAVIHAECNSIRANMHDYFNRLSDQLRDK